LARSNWNTDLRLLYPAPQFTDHRLLQNADASHNHVNHHDDYNDYDHDQTPNHHSATYDYEYDNDHDQTPNYNLDHDGGTYDDEHNYDDDHAANYHHHKHNYNHHNHAKADHDQAPARDYAHLTCAVMTRRLLSQHTQRAEEAVIGSTRGAADHARSANQGRLTR